MVAIRRYTNADLDHFSDADEPFELIDGELRSLASSFESAELADFLSNLLGNWVRSRQLGTVLGPDGGYILAPDTVLFPDVSFVQSDRVPIGEARRRRYSGAPDLAVEVRSPTNTITQQHNKLRRYLAAGTELAWFLDPLRQRGSVWLPDQAPRELSHADALDGLHVLPGLRIPLDRLFALDGSLLREMLPD